MNTQFALPIYGQPHRIADTSREAFEHIVTTLTDREIEAFLAVCDYLTATGHQDVTGKELADWLGREVTTIRPRFTGLVDKGWLRYTEARASRAANEGKCHPVACVLPREAVERARKERPR